MKSIDEILEELNDYWKKAATFYRWHDEDGPAIEESNDTKKWYQTKDDKSNP